MTLTNGPTPATMPGDSAPRGAKPPGRVVSIRKAVVLAVIAAVLTGLLSAAATTLITRGQVDDLEAQVGTLTSRVSGLTEQVDGLAADKEGLTAAAGSSRAELEALTRQNAELRAQLEGAASEEPPVAEVSYDAVVKADTWFLHEGTGAFLLIVDVTVTNPDADRDAYFSPYDFRLKGLDGTVYPLIDQSPVASQPRFLSGVSDLPGGRIQVGSQGLAPAETIKGSLVFYVPKPVQKFSITYRGQTSALGL